MKRNERVIFCSAEWVFIEEIDGMYLLRSVNKNLNDVWANPKYVKRLKFDEKKRMILISGFSMTLNNR